MQRSRAPLTVLQRPEAKVTWMKLGEEEINGVKTIKWNGVIKEKNLMVPFVLWSDAKTRYPVRYYNADATTEWKNLKVGPQDPNLFELPAGYTKE